MGDCWNYSCSFDRTYVGAGRRCRRASVQAIVRPLPRDWAGRQNQARPHRSMASMAARAAPSRVSTTPQPINLLALPGAKKLSPNISARRCKKCRVRAWHLSASKTTRTSQTSGPISSNSGLMGRRNEARRAGKRRKSKRAAGRVGAAARLTSVLG
jgi:hypothetical protein